MSLGQLRALRVFVFVMLAWSHVVYAGDAPEVMPPLLAALRAKGSVEELALAQKRARGADADVIERLQRAMTGGKQIEVYDALVELDHRWLKLATGLERRREAILTLAQLAMARRELDPTPKPWSAEAITLAKELTRRFPKEAGAHELLGILLGLPPAQAMPALEAFAACLTIDPTSPRCRPPFNEIARAVTAPQCAGADIRAISLVAPSLGNKPVLTQDDLQAIADPAALGEAECKGSVLILKPFGKNAGRVRLPTGNEPTDLVLNVEGQVRQRLRLALRGDNELVCMDRVPLAEVCHRASRPKLPERLTRWIQTEPPPRR